MTIASVLNVVIPLVILGYGAYLVVRLARNRRRGCSHGGCSHCPMAGSCRMLEEQEQKKEQERHEP